MMADTYCPKGVAVKNHVLSVANVFIQLAQKDGIVLKHIRLHKLLYFAQGHSFGLRQEPILDEQPEAGPHGPLFPFVFQQLIEEESDILDNEILYYDYEAGNLVSPPPVSCPEDLEILNAVWGAYKSRTLESLHHMSCTKDGPWDRVVGTYRNAKIRDEDMIEFFNTPSTSLSH